MSMISNLHQHPLQPKSGNAKGKKFRNLMPIFTAAINKNFNNKVNFNEFEENQLQSAKQKLLKSQEKIKSENNPSVNKKIDYEKIFKLFNGKQTTFLFERHCSILEKLSKVYENGFPVDELKEITDLLKLTKKKIKTGGKELMKPLLKLIRICGMNFIKSNPYAEYSDEELNDIVNLITESSSMIEFNNTEILSCVTDNLFDSSQPSEIYKLEKTQVTNILLDYLNNYVNDSTQLEMILRVFSKFTAHSEIICHQIIDSNGLEIICKAVNNSDDMGIVTLFVDCIWNVVDSQYGKTASKILCQHDNLKIFSKIFENFSLNSNRTLKKQLRNEIGILILEISQKILISDFKIFKSEVEYNDEVEENNLIMNFKDVGLYDLIFKFLKSVEINNLSLNHYHFTTNSMEDYEFKKILLSILHVFINNKNLLMDVLNSDFLEFILMYTTYQSVKESVKIWNLRQLKGLQLQIIFLLNSIISNTKKMQKYLLNTSKCEKFMEKCFINLENLNTLLQQFLKNETVVGLIKFLSLTMQYETNVIEFGKNNVESEVIGLIPAVLRSVLLLSEVSLEAQVKLGNFGVFDPVFELLNDKTQTSEVWKISLLICSSVCKNCEENKVLFGNAEGVNTVISFLNYKSPDIKEEESVLLSVTECIWSAICGNHKNEESFFHLNGIYDLLDLLEIKTSDLRKHLLSCLLDLTEIPKTSFMIMEWRRKTKGKTHQGIEHYLIELWNFEEKHIEISQGDHGVLNNFYSPLIGKNNNKASVQSNNMEFEGFCINEITLNLRAKVYSLFCKLGFENFYSTLSNVERVKLELISKYLDFKISEVWEEISEELYVEGIRPTTPDLNSIKESGVIVNEKALQVYKSQIEVLQQHEKIEKVEENKFLENFGKRWVEIKEDKKKLKYKKPIKIKELE